MSLFTCKIGFQFPISGEIFTLYKKPKLEDGLYIAMNSSGQDMNFDQYGNYLSDEHLVWMKTHANKDVGDTIEVVDNITNINEEKTYPKNRSLLTGIQSLIAGYDGEISTAEAIGVLEIVKSGLINGGDE